MRVSAKADYAVRAMIVLAAAEPDEPVKGEAIAEAQTIPMAFMENILSELRQNGLVHSKRGAEGGYWLAVEPARIRIADIVRAVEGPLATVRGDDLPLGQFELLGLGTRDLRPKGIAVGEHELDANLEPEVHDPLDHRLLGAGRRDVRDLDVVRADEQRAPAVDLADEAHHELGRRMLVEVARGPGLLDLAMVHHDDLLGDVHRLLLVVRDEDRGHVNLVVETPQPFAELLADRRVERAKRLVEQQHLRLHRERPCERHALALAAGELRRITVDQALQV